MKKIFILSLLAFFSCEKDPNCSINESNAGSQIYDLDEAACFIALKLKKTKKSELMLIRSALMAGENYMKKIGLISENPSEETDSEAVPVMDIIELVKYAQHEKKVDLPEEVLINIYDTEIEYLTFIGVAG